LKHRSPFLKLVEWSDQDDCFVGSLLPEIGPCCHGNNEETVYKELCRIADEWEKIYKKDGDPLPKNALKREYSGKFFVRTQKELHKALVIQALQAGQSLNSLVGNILKKEILQHH